MKNNKLVIINFIILLLVIVMVVLIFIKMGDQSNGLTKIERLINQSNKVVSQPVVIKEEKSDEKMAAVDDDKIQALNEKISKLENENLVKDFYIQVDEVAFHKSILQDPDNKNIFYYVTNDPFIAAANADGTANFDVKIQRYDLSKDTEYKKTGYFDFTSKNANTLIYQEKLGEYTSFTLNSLDDQKLVFYFYYTDYSPGPCFQHYLRDDFVYIDLENIAGGKQKYVVPKKLTDEAESKEAECLKEMNNLLN